MAVALLLFLLALAFPRQGISLSPNVHLKFISLSDWGSKDPVQDPARVEALLALADVSEDPEADFQALPESLPTARPVNPANVDSLKKHIRPIEYAEGEEKLLHPFFASLDQVSRGERRRTRIMHFGDSQIEIDRMTALIRYRLQKQFGGSGCGLVQALPLYSGHMSYRQETEGDWQRYTFFGSRDSTIAHRSYGVMGAFTAVPPPPQAEDVPWPALHYEFRTSRRGGTVNRVVVFLHSYVDQASMALVVNDSISDTIRNISAGFSLAEYSHPEQIKRFSLHLNLPQGGRVYGISFESHGGLQMDNIAMRGGSGLIFTKMNRELQLRMMEYLAPTLLILQYGGNVVPYINADRYYQGFKRELAFLQDLCPGTPILLVGPSDMSQKVGGDFESYPGVEPVRDALRQAAMESGCGFWDLYEAMGGHNSMPSFVHADPPLASTDYIHFTSLGVNLVADLFYRALMAEYQQYKRTAP